MRRELKILGMFMVIGALFLTGCTGAKTKYMTVSEIEPKMEKMVINGKAVEEYGAKGEEGFTAYQEIGVKEYDEFFKSSARLEGLSVIANEVVKDSTETLKSISLSKTVNEVSGNVKEIIEVLKDLKKAGKLEIKNEEIQKILTIKKNAETLFSVMGETKDEVKNLIENGKELNEKVGELSPSKTPVATKEMAKSMNSLQNFADNSVKLLEELKGLVEALQVLAV